MQIAGILPTAFTLLLAQRLSQAHQLRMKRDNTWEVQQKDAPLSLDEMFRKPAIRGTVSLKTYCRKNRATARGMRNGG